MRHLSARRPLLVWAAAAILTSFTSYGELSTIDALTMLDSARPLAVGDMPVVTRVPGEMGTDGRIYTKYAPANTLLLVPAIWIGAGVEGFGYGETERTLIEEFAASQIAAAARAVVAVLVFVLLERLRPHRRANLVLAMLSLVTGFDAQYSRSYYSETMVAIGVLGAAIGLVRVSTDSSRAISAAAGVGALCAMNAAFRYETAAFVPVFAALLLSVLPVEKRRPALMAFGAPVAAAALVMGAFNAIRFGAPWVTGYPGGLWAATPWPGSAGILLSPGAGLVWFVPIAFGLLLPATWTVEPTPAHRVLRRTLVGLLVVDVLVCGSFLAWSGSAWGPRFLAVLVPLLYVCVVDAWFKSPSARRVGVGLAGAGVAMNVLLLVSPYERYQASASATGWTNDQRLWSIGASPLLHQPRLAREVLANLDDLERFSVRAQQRLGARGTTDRFRPDDAAEMLRTSVLLNVPALWWLKATLAGIPAWLSGVTVLAGLLIAAAALVVAWRASPRHA